MTSYRHASGQALPLALGLAGVGALALLAFYNLGQVIAGRARLTHTADAAAYSGALVQARAMNFLAYVQRAQVAHQVAMAHLVTLASWAQFGQAERQRLLQGNPPGPLIGMLFGAAHGRAYASAVAAADGQGLLMQFERAHARHDALVHRVLSASARATLAQVRDGRREAMRAVVQANYPELPIPEISESGLPPRDRLSMAVLADEWDGFVRRHPGRGQGALRAMTLSATDRYGFLGPRNGIARNAWPVSFRCPTWRHELRRRGATRLDGSGTWHSTDTQSFHKLRSNKYIGCYYREYAMGWGKADARSAGQGKAESGVDAPQDFSREAFWKWVRANTSWDIVHGIANPLAYAYAMKGAARWSSGGLPAYAEVPLRRAAVPARFALRLRHPAPLLKTIGARSGIPAAPGRLSPADLDDGDAIEVISAAEVYFARPEPRGDGADELATLFRPYWQARLAPMREDKRIRQTRITGWRLADRALAPAAPGGDGNHGD